MDPVLDSNSLKPEFQTGVPSLDIDDKLLFGLIEQVIAAQDTGDRVVVKGAVLAFLSATIAHFDREQRLMQACGLDHELVTRHSARHEKILVGIVGLIDGLGSGSTNLLAVGSTLRAGLENHIVEDDIPLARAITAHHLVPLHPQPATPSPAPQLPKVEPGLRPRNRIEPIVWGPAIETGLAEVDADHRVLVDLCNVLLIRHATATKHEIGVMLAELGDAISAHFEREERLMSARGYPEAGDHRAEHQRLLEEYGHQVDDWRSNVLSIDALCSFIYLWLPRHIATMDTFLNQKSSQQKPA